MRIIDLRSDTVTHPTDEMRRAMFEARVGDDVYGEDPTINTLEQMSAAMMGKEASLFVTSGTMGNLIAVLAQTNRGDEIIVGSLAHVFWYEVGGASALGGVMMRTVQNDAGGQIPLDMVEQAIRTKNVHFPTTTLLCLENTHNLCGGAVLTPEYTSAAASTAHARGLRVHIDGARIFNAAIALGITASQLAAEADSVSFCLSKGLSAPVGSLLCGDRAFIDRARRLRKMLGGGMRQAGVLAAAGIVALNTMIGRLAEDHENARRLARGIAGLPGFALVADVRTNIVMFDVPSEIHGSEFAQRAESRGVRLSYRGGNQFRAVTHRMITSADIDEALERLRSCATA